MSFFDIDTVRRTHIAEKISFPVDMASVKPLSNIYAERVNTATLKGIAGGSAVYVINGGEGTRHLDASTGDTWMGMAETEIRIAAASYYTGDTLPISLKYIGQAPIEYRGMLPVWQVTYDDGPKTRLYLDAQTGELKAVRTQL